MDKEVFDQISDGKFYELNDMVKVSCNDCKGCSSCCQGMGTSIILDPLDCYRLTTALNQTFEELLANVLELNVVEGIILPNLKMAGEAESCTFLNNEGRCRIHPFRPGICRLFPLGRFYEENSFKYFLQVYECKKPNKTKIKVQKWIDTPDIKKNEKFINEWHYFLKELKQIVNNSQDDGVMKSCNMNLLRIFFMKPYQTDTDFYVQFYERLQEAKECFATIDIHLS